MDNILQRIIDTYVQEYQRRLTKTFDLDQEKLQKLWATVRKSTISESESLCTDSVPSSPASSLSPSPASSPSPRTSPSSESSVEIKRCPYRFVKGDNKGKVCGKSPSGDGTYCSRHKKYEGKAPKKKAPSTTKKSLSHHKKTPKKVTPRPDRYLRKHSELHVYYHPETDLVFDKVSRRVTGKIKDGEVVTMTEKDKETCHKFGFGYTVHEESATQVKARIAAITHGSPERQHKELEAAVTTTNLAAGAVEEILSILQVPAKTPSPLDELQSRGSSLPDSEEIYDSDDSGSELTEDG